MEKSKIKPEVFKKGLVEVCLWERVYNGKKFFNVTVNKIYMDKKTNKWNKNNSFNIEDLNTLEELFLNVRKHIMLNK